MTDIASPLAPEPGKRRRALAAVVAFLRAMESTGFDYTLDRLERLEEEVEQLRRQVRQGSDPGPVDAHNASAAGLEH